MTLAAAVSNNNTVLVLAALLGIATVVVLITWLKVHPFLALILGSGVLGLVAGLGPSPTVDSFTKGVGATVGSVGLLIALGAMIGGLLADSGGADRIVQTIVERVSPGMLPWAMAGAAALVGIPLFFEVGVVLLVPIVLLVGRRTDVPLMKVGIPALAGLSVLHGFVPPHPGPLVAIAALKADLGLTLALGLLVAIPCVIIAGPVFGSFISRYVPVAWPPLIAGREPVPVGGSTAAAELAELDNPDAGERRTVRGSVGQHRDGVPRRIADRDRDGVPGRLADRDRDGVPDRLEGDRPLRRPAFGPTVLTVLLPVILMLARAIGEITLDKGSQLRGALDVLGNPVVALLAGVLVGMFTLGVASGMDRSRVSASVGAALPPIAGILLIVAAGGGFKQTLIDAGVGNVIADAAKGANISALVLGWLVAVGIRLATGSATVATITAAGIVAPLAEGLDRPSVALLVLAIGAGSLFFSHVNDAGFWLVKEYFGMTVGQTIKTWSIMETIISVVGLVVVLLLNLVL
ncbi:MAG: SLC13 family permease [Mycobacteriales bacterium]